MRLGAPPPPYDDDPDRWIAIVKALNYSAVYSPLSYSPELKSDTIEAFRKAAEDADLVIAEVGAWSNPLDPDSEKAAAAMEKCIHSLALAEQIGARCCVNIVGSRNPNKWSGPHPDNFSRETFDLIVESTRKIIDAVNPKRSYYALETMPWIFPSTPDQYLDLLKAIDRPAMAVHLDPVNMINCPERVFNSGALIRESFSKLGLYIKSCHAKDIILQEKLTVHLDECMPGTGVLDYPTFLRELSKLDPNTPLMLEHLPLDQYPQAAANIRAIAATCNLNIK
ncbi:MAG: sugar phosphate isomerase/epimerase family protein [Verrucomicrobiota bacterium JB024]|nr:sugar phosphate isomerase/epimerase family protein [Verrucomicrobiota bacterium JB024]